MAQVPGGLLIQRRLEQALVGCFSSLTGQVSDRPCSRSTSPATPCSKTGSAQLLITVKCRIATPHLANLPELAELCPGLPRPLQDPVHGVPLENGIPSLAWAFSGFSGGSPVFVDQAAGDRFSVDLARAGVSCGDAGSGVRVRDALVEALMGPGGVVMLLVLGQDGAQVDLVQDQGPVEELTAQGANKALAIAFIRGVCTAVRTMVVPVAWKAASKDAVKFEPRSRIRNRRSPNRSPGSGARLRACCTVQSPVGQAVTPPRCIRRVPCSTNSSTYSLVSATVSTGRKSAARIPAACACRNRRQARRGAGSMPAARRIS